MEKSVERSSPQGRIPSIDLFKIVSMLMVVVLHSNNFGGILYNAAPNSALRVISTALEVVCIVAVNCFALTSGFLNGDRKVRIKNIINLYLQVLFFSLLFFFVFCLCGKEEFSLNGLFLYSTPVTSSIYWYFTSYFILFLFMPLLNTVIERAEKKTVCITLSVLAVIFGIVSYVASFHAGDVFNLKNGYSALWLIYLYLVGGAIKKYGFSFSIKGRKIPAYIYLLLFFLSCLLNVLFGLMMRIDSSYPPMIFEYNFILNFISSLALLLFFANLKVKEFKIITFFARTSFGVYLIHEHPYVRKHIIQNSLFPLLKINPLLALLGIIGFVLAVYLICTAIEYIRQVLFSLAKVNKLTVFIDKKLSGITSKNEKHLE